MQLLVTASRSFACVVAGFVCKFLPVISYYLKVHSVESIQSRVDVLLHLKIFCVAFVSVTCDGKHIILLLGRWSQDPLKATFDNQRRHDGMLKADYVLLDRVWQLAGVAPKDEAT